MGGSLELRGIRLLRLGSELQPHRPVICTFGGDPVKPGFVESVNRPGKNVTGIMVLTADLEAKRLELPHELVPSPGSFGVLLDPTFPDAEAHLKEVQFAARTLGRDIQVSNASIEKRSTRRSRPSCNRG